MQQANAARTLPLLVSTSAMKTGRYSTLATVLQAATLQQRKLFFLKALSGHVISIAAAATQACSAEGP